MGAWVVAGVSSGRAGGATRALVSIWLRRSLHQGSRAPLKNPRRVSSIAPIGWPLAVFASNGRSGRALKIQRPPTHPGCSCGQNGFQTLRWARGDWTLHPSSPPRQWRSLFSLHGLAQRGDTPRRMVFLPPSGKRDALVTMGK